DSASFYFAPVKCFILLEKTSIIFQNIPIPYPASNKFIYFSHHFYLLLSQLPLNIHFLIPVNLLAICHTFLLQHIFPSIFFIHHEQELICIFLTIIFLSMFVEHLSFSNLEYPYLL